MGITGLTMTLYVFASNYAPLESLSRSDFPLIAMNALSGAYHLKYSGIPSTVFDLWVFFLTVAKAYSTPGAFKYTNKLVQVMVEDGALFFLAMVIMNLVNVLLLMGVLPIRIFGVTEIVFLNFPVIGSNTAPVISLSTTLISYLVLHLRKTTRDLSTVGRSTLDISSFQVQSSLDRRCLYSTDSDEIELQEF